MRTQQYLKGGGEEASASSAPASAVTGVLSRRDWAIMRTLQRVHFATNVQLEHLHFDALPDRERIAQCQSALSRLVALSVLATCNPSLSSQGVPVLTYMLGTVGPSLVTASGSTHSHADRALRAVEDDDQQLARALDITQLFVDLVQLDRAGKLRLEAFQTSPASQWSDGLGGTITPDAFIRVARGDTTDFWWVEVDHEARSVTQALVKLRAYGDFLRRQAPGPEGVIPQILLATQNSDRTEALQFVLDGLAEERRKMFTVTDLADAARVIQRSLS
jgi:Replication-relaxation